MKIVQLYKLFKPPEIGGENKEELIKYFFDAEEMQNHINEHPEIQSGAIGCRLVTAIIFDQLHSVQMDT